MIKSVTVTEGYAATLPSLAGKTFKFTPGFNVLFGPNGCGKTSLLKILAGYTLCQNGGWSSYAHDGFPTIETEGRAIIFPDSQIVNHCKAKLAWDGTACYFAHTSTTDAPISQFGMTGDSMDEELAVILCKPSDGQKRLSRINKMAKALKEIPSLTESKIKSTEIKKFVEYVKGLSRKGPPTLLLDEPDRSLSPENQAVLWAALPKMAENFQIIIASQSMLPLLRIPEGVNIIDVEEGYFGHNKTVLDLYSQGKSYVEIVMLANKIREADAKIREGKKKK